MPHKHTRKGDDFTDFDLAPDKTARPLPALKTGPSTKDGKRARSSDKISQPRKKQRTNIQGYGLDDTPRAFARIMQAQSGKSRPSGLDDDTRISKSKINTQSNQKQPMELPAQTEPAPIQRLPGESLRDFSIRVDQALPISGLAHKGKKVEGVKERRTKTEKRLHKLYDEWRSEEARIKAREEEDAEQAEEQQEERAAEFNGQDINLPMSRRAKKRRAIGEVGVMEDDPWAVLKSRRQAPKGLHDVVQAPPDLKVVPKEVFNVRNGAKVKVANVPLASGSLKKREELGAARAEVIERYRSMMKTGIRS